DDSPAAFEVGQELVYRAFLRAEDPAATVDEHNRRRWVRIITWVPDVELERCIVCTAVHNIRLHPVAVGDLEKHGRGVRSLRVGRSREQAENKDDKSPPLRPKN